jgi:phosphomannomutase
MRPDRVEVLWDGAKSKWLIRIETGEEVIRCNCEAPKNADDQTLRSAVQKTVEDEGYDLDPTSVSIRR